MADVTQYIGARYVPLFADPVEWSNTKQYEPLTVVLHQGNSYTSRQFVPVGIDIDNADFWAETGNYNAQVEQCKQDVLALRHNVNALLDGFESLDKKETINTRIEALNSCFWRASERFMIGKHDYTTFPFLGSGGVQSSCMIDINGHDYFVLLTGSDNANQVNIIDTTTHTPISTTTLDLGHGNSISSRENSNIIISANHLRNTLDIVQVQTPNFPNLIARISAPTQGNKVIQGCCYIGNTEKVAIVLGLYSGYNWNISEVLIYSDYNLQTLEETIALEWNSNLSASFQGMHCDGDIFYFIQDCPKGIYCVDRHTGKYVGTFVPAARYGHICVEELESFFTWKSAAYFSAQYVTGCEVFNSIRDNLRTVSLMKCAFDYNFNGRPYDIGSLQIGSSDESLYYPVNANSANWTDLNTRLVNPRASRKPTFYLVSDAINYCRAVNIYPHVYILQAHEAFSYVFVGCSATLDYNTDYDVGGLYIENSVMRIYARKTVNMHHEVGTGTNRLMQIYLSQVGIRGFNLIHPLDTEEYPISNRIFNSFSVINYTGTNDEITFEGSGHLLPSA